MKISTTLRQNRSKTKPGNLQVPRQRVGANTISIDTLIERNLSEKNTHPTQVSHFSEPKYEGSLGETPKPFIKDLLEIHSHKSPEKRIGQKL